MNEGANAFRRRFLLYIVLAWTIPPVFGFAFLMLIEMFSPREVFLILTAPIEPAFAVTALALAVWHFRRHFCTPLQRELERGEEGSSRLVMERIRAFPLHFWALFLGTLLIAPATVMVSAEIYAGYQPQPIDWFRIHLVALIVSIIVGLPIFFLILDLFGYHFGRFELQHPVVTLKTKVFIIGAFSPLLIDTMLVQYYWTRTGFFGLETFAVWLALELLAVAGAVLFARSFAQSLMPLRTLIDQNLGTHLEALQQLVPRSTDELGHLTRDIRTLLTEQAMHRERLEINNQLLQLAPDYASMEVLLEKVVEKGCLRLGGDLCFLMVHDTESNELVCQVSNETGFQEEGYFRLPLEADSVLTRAFRDREVLTLDDLEGYSGGDLSDYRELGLQSVGAAPLLVTGQPVGVLVCGHRTPHHFTDCDRRMLQAFAQEAALVETFARDFAKRTRVEQAITQIMEGVSTAIGEEFFSAVSMRMANILKADGVGVGILPDGMDDRIQTLAFILDGEVQPNIVYETEGTPCGNVIGKKVCSYTSGLQERFPDDQVLKDLELQAYVGIPLFDASGQAIGVQFALFRRPLEDAEFVETVMRIFAARTSAEIERLRIERQMSQMAYYDSLTGLPNRKLLMDRLGQALVHAERDNSSIAVMMLDLDHFKAINDSLGHPVGDQLLIEVASRLQGCVRSEDTVARLGGDEFVVLLWGLGSQAEAVQDTTRVAAKIRERLSEPYVIEGRNLIVTPSFGIALFPENGRTADVLLKHADTAMYQAKSRGRDNYQFFSKAMNIAAVERLEKENGLRQALEKNEFEVFYQPKIAIDTGKILGAEALLRWRHPSRGLITPESFIPVAEESGLIVPIGSWVFREACKATAELWCSRGDCGAPGALSVNVSPRQFMQPDFVSHIEEILETEGARPGCMELELTENVLIHDPADVQTKLERLKALGLRISIDDFGTGYSSLAYLKELPIDIIKIDRSFIRDVPQDPNDSVLVETIVAMARHLGIRTIAEGVETEEQLEFLSALGCDIYQGYLFSQPVSLQELKGMMAVPPAANRPA